MSEQKMKRRVWSCVSSTFSEEVNDYKEPEALPWEESLCDLTDFVPLAELVRSFQPRDNTVEPEFEYPDGQEPDTWEPPTEVDDIADIALEVRERSAAVESELKRSLAERSGQASGITEKTQLNASNPDARAERAAEAGAKDE